MSSLALMLSQPLWLALSRRVGKKRAYQFALALPVFTFALAPLAAHYSRRHEFEADAFAARVSGGPALVRALVKLYEDNAATLTPDPVHSAFYDSHPPAGERVARLASLAPVAA